MRERKKSGVMSSDFLPALSERFTITVFYLPADNNDVPLWALMVIL
jgi:hypothetical protein